MRFTFTIEVEVNRIEGKFATRDEIAEQIQDELENAQPSQLEGENGGQYEVADWSVSLEPTEQERKAAAKLRNEVAAENDAAWKDEFRDELYKN